MENEEIKKRIENAQKFREFLKPYPPQIQARFIYAKNPDAYREIDPTLKETADEFFDLRKDYFTHGNAVAPQDKEPEKKEKEYKTEGFHGTHGSENTNDDLSGSLEEQPRTRLEQMEKAGKAITEGNTGNDDWGYYEPVPASPPPSSFPSPRPLTQHVSGLRQIPSKRALRQSLRRPGHRGNSPGSPILKNKAKNQLKKKLLGAAKKRAAMAILGSIGLPAIVIGLLIFIFIVVFIILIMAMGCYIVNNPIGDLIGANYCKINNDGANRFPPPVPSPEKPTSITFKGGEAYLTTGDGCRTNCPAVNKGDTATIKIEIFLNTNEFDKDIKNVRAIMQIDHRFFSSITATGGPEITLAPTVNYSLYRWKLTNPKEGQNHYTFTVTGKVQSDNGETNVVLTMNGVTITDKDLGDLYAGANSPPSNNTCNKYGGIMDDIKKYGISPSNFGDPICNYTDEKFKAVVEDTEKNPVNVEFWLKIAGCEGKSPNTFARQKGLGLGAAFGRFQMGRNEFTRNQGNVTWQRQIQNAIYYNDKWINSDFSYWGTARCFCALDKYKSKPYCKGIIEKGLQRNNCSNSCIN